MGEATEVRLDDIIGPDETKTIKLRKPVSYANVTYKEISLREPTIGESKEAAKRGLGDDFTTTLILLSIVSGVPPEAIELMGISVLDEAADFLGKFTPNGVRVGR